MAGVVRGKTLLAPTLKAVASASVPSHQLLLRGGYIRQAGQGLFNLLPLGLRSMRKLEKIIDEEMESIGGQKLALTTLTSSELWRKSGRWDEAGEELIKVKDRKGAEYCLAPTHEEEITNLVANEVFSYRSLPLRLYQIGPKYRDEIRPRFGLMRGREFIMKDMYTFDVDREAAMETYEAVCQAYLRIFEAIGINVRRVSADSGNIGGSLSHEFQLLSPIGEDDVLSCPSCGHAANKELAQGVVVSQQGGEAPSVFSLLGALLGHDAGCSVTPVISLAKDHAALAFTASGRQANPLALKDLLPHPQETTLHSLLTHLPTLQSLTLAFDSMLPEPVLGSKADQEMSLRRFVSSLKERVAQSDSPLNITPPLEEQLADLLRQSLQGLRAGMHLRFACAGDGCPVCSSSALVSLKGIELGHAFWLGTKYSEKMGAMIQGGQKNDPKKPAQMGCFGLGLGRILAGVVEVSHDEQGIIWPPSLAPYRVCFVADKHLAQKAQEFCEGLTRTCPQLRGEVVLDDRDETVGYRLKDSLLIGYPYIAIMGKSYLSSNKLEVFLRNERRKELMTEEEFASFVQKASCQ